MELEVILRRYARRLARSAPACLDADDLMQCGRLSFLSSQESYDPSTGVPFELFALQRARRAMIDELRRMGGRASRGKNAPLPLSDLVPPEISHEDWLNYESGGLPDEQEEQRARQELQRLIDRLPPKFAGPISMRLQGFGYARIGEVRGYSEARAYQVVTHVARKLRWQFQ